MDNGVKTPLLGLSDPLTAPTGFGRVARELFVRIPQDQFDLGYLAYGSGWHGTRKFPGIVAYAEQRDVSFARMCQTAFPRVVLDFVGAKKPFLLWSLLDPWQLGWLALPETSPLRYPDTTRFLGEHRVRFKWISYFPIDGLGPRDGPARWVEQFIDEMDYPVAMSDWGRRLCQPYCKKEIRFISHAVDTERFYPIDKGKAREYLERKFFQSAARYLANSREGLKDEPERLLKETDEMRIRLVESEFVLVCVMANRARKYWYDVLRAFAAVVEQIPSARLIGVCGDREGDTSGDAVPLEDVCRELGLVLDGDKSPQAWLIEAIMSENPGLEDEWFQNIYNAADATIIVSGGEGFGLPQLEAHACARPCIVGDYSASTELAIDHHELIAPASFYVLGGNQIRRPIYRVRDIVDKLMYAAKNPSWRVEVGDAGLLQAQERSWSQIMPKWLELFGEAAALIGQTQEDADAKVVSEATVGA